MYEDPNYGYKYVLVMGPKVVRFLVTRAGH